METCAEPEAADGFPGQHFAERLVDLPDGNGESDALPVTTGLAKPLSECGFADGRYRLAVQ